MGIHKRQKSHRVGPPLKKKVPPYRFPPAGRYEIFNTPIFHVVVGEQEELLRCKGRLVVETSDAISTRKGLRRIDLEVVDWEASGESRLLGGTVKFVVTKGLKAYVDAGSERADFPGRMTVGVRAQTYLNDQQVDEHESKVTGLISAFPPQEGDLFDISWGGLQLDNIRVGGVMCACATLEDIALPGVN